MDILYINTIVHRKERGGKNDTFCPPPRGRGGRIGVGATGRGFPGVIQIP
jgi:hypothetical protein